MSDDVVDGGDRTFGGRAPGERLAFFEGEEFALAPIRVTGERSGELEAMHFAHTDRKPIDEAAWTLEGWQAKTKPDTLRRIHRYMSHFGVLSVAEADAHR